MTRLSRKRNVQVEEMYILLMKTGEFATLHEKTGLALPVDRFDSATMTNDLDDLKRWISHHDDNIDLVDIYYFNVELEPL